MVLSQMVYRVHSHWGYLHLHSHFHLTSIRWYAHTHIHTHTLTHMHTSSIIQATSPQMFYFEHMWFAAHNQIQGDDQHPNKDSMAV